MVTGSRIGPVSQKAQYLKKRIPDVERLTGIRFGEKFHSILNDGSYISNSEPPSIAFNVFKSIRPTQILDLGHAIQKAHYVDGEDLNRMSPYFKICEVFGINKRAFMDRYNDPLFKEQTLYFFGLAKSLGIENFPAIMLEKAGKMNLIQKGYTKYIVLEKLLKDIDPIK